MPSIPHVCSLLATSRSTTFRSFDVLNEFQRRINSHNYPTIDVYQIKMKIKFHRIIDELIIYPSSSSFLSDGARLFLTLNSKLLTNNLIEFNLRRLSSSPSKTIFSFPRPVPGEFAPELWTQKTPPLNHVT